MKCESCEQEFDVLNVFSPYGHDNPYMREESLKNTGYCDKCFELKKKNLNSMVYDNMQEKSA